MSINPDTLYSTNALLYETTPNLLEDDDSKQKWGSLTSARRDQSEQDVGLTPFEASLALLSTIVGGGIVGLPYAMYHCGIIVGFFLNVVLVAMTYQSFHLYMASKNLSPVPVESILELGYLAMGKKSIYILSVVILIASFGLQMIYFITFGDCLASIILQWCYDSDAENLMTSRIPYIFALGLCLTPIIIKKELAEMKIISIILFVSLSLFVLIFIIQLAMGQNENPDRDFSSYWRVQWNSKLVTAFSVVLVAYSCQQNIFPMYCSLKSKTQESANKSIIGGLGMSFGIYVLLGIISVYLFGSTIDESVLVNVDEETSPSSYVIRFSFLLVLACHIPYIFYSGKESLCIIVDELKRNSTSLALSKKLENQTNEPQTGSWELSANVYEAEEIDESISEDQDQKQEPKKEELMAYKSMNQTLYYALTISLFVTEMICACFVPDIGVIFDFVAALSINCLAFILPGVFYVRISGMYSQKVGKNHGILKCVAWFYIIFGIFSTVFVFTVTCIKVSKGDD